LRWQIFAAFRRWRGYPVYSYSCLSKISFENRIGYEAGDIVAMMLGAALNSMPCLNRIMTNAKANSNRAIPKCM
jgi:hypothetical protein